MNQNENLTEEEKIALDRAAAEADVEYYNNGYSWTEMDDGYYEMLRKQHNVGEDKIGPRNFKTFIMPEAALYIMVIPAGKQHDGEKTTQYYHTIIEDLQFGECNGSYDLVTEETLFEKFNIKYNNK